MVQTGNRAPDFMLVSADGSQIKLDNLSGGIPVLLAFYKVSCPTCQLALPFLERLRTKAGERLRVAPVSQDLPGSTRDFEQYFRISGSLFDRAADGYPASNAFAITHVPSMFLIEPDGSIAWADHGFQRDSLAALARRFGVDLFEAGDNVPDWRPG